MHGGRERFYSETVVQIRKKGFFKENTIEKRINDFLIFSKKKNNF